MTRLALAAPLAPLVVVVAARIYVSRWLLVFAARAMARPP